MEAVGAAAQAVGGAVSRAPLTEHGQTMANRMREAVRALLLGCGEDTTREGLQDTPSRVVRALWEMTEGYGIDPKKVLATRFTAHAYDELVVVRDMPFWSLCEHHMLPFHGTATIGYLPNGHVVGLSKLARLLHCYSRRLQIQEQMTEQIAAALDTHLTPRGVGVIVRARHLCMEMRGVKVPGETVTSFLTGVLREDSKARAEFMALRSG